MQRATVRMERWRVLAMITAASTPFSPMSMSGPPPPRGRPRRGGRPPLPGGPNGGAGQPTRTRTLGVLPPQQAAPSPSAPGGLYADERYQRGETGIPSYEAGQPVPAPPAGGRTRDPCPCQRCSANWTALTRFLAPLLPAPQAGATRHAHRHECRALSEIMRGSRVRPQASFVTYGKGHTPFAWTATRSIRDNAPLPRIVRD